MLLKEFFLLLPAEKAVVEIQETVPLDEAVVAACQQLQLKGYRIALDNFVLGDARATITGQEKCSELVPSSLVRAHQMTAAGTGENQSCLFAKAATNLGIRDRLAIACLAR